MNKFSWIDKIPNPCFSKILWSNKVINDEKWIYTKSEHIRVLENFYEMAVTYDDFKVLWWFCEFFDELSGKVLSKMLELATSEEINRIIRILPRGYTLNKNRDIVKGDYKYSWIEQFDNKNDDEWTEPDDSDEDDLLDSKRPLTRIFW